MIEPTITIPAMRYTQGSMRSVAAAPAASEFIRIPKIRYLTY